MIVCIKSFDFGNGLNSGVMANSNSVFRMFVYILKCVDESFYIGVTNNLEIRLGEHQSGKSPGSYTYSRRPVELVYYTGFQDPDSAIRFEKRIKKWSRAKKIALINGDFHLLPNLSKKKFE